MKAFQLASFRLMDAALAKLPTKLLGSKNFLLKVYMWN